VFLGEQKRRLTGRVHGLWQRLCGLDFGKYGS
jgi:hypothetical protein